MKQMGLKAKIRAKKAYRHPAMGEISEHLLKRRFKARKPNEKWLTDVTELKGKDGKLYLSPILDLFNREIIAYAMSRNANSEMVKEMLEKAAPRLTDKGTMLHSDQGVLYRTAGYRELLAQHSMVQSMSRKANCWDNAPMESFFAVLKTECFYNAGELTVDELMKQIDDYMDYYNRERCSLKLKKLSPVAYRTQLIQSGGFGFEVQLSIIEKGQYAVAYGLSCKKDCHELHTTDPRRTIPYPIPVPPLHRHRNRQTA